MSFDTEFAGLRDDAIALVKAAGRPTACQLIRTTDGTPADSGKPWRVGTPSTKTFLFTGVVVPYGQAASQPSPDEEVTIIVPGDVGAVTAEEDGITLCGDIQATDRIVTDSQQYQILAITNLKPGSQTIIFKLRCKAWPSITMTPATQFSAS